MSTASTLEPPRGIALNAFHLECPGLHTLARIPRPSTRGERKAIEQEIGHTLFVANEYAYTVVGAAIAGAEDVEVECSSNRQLHLYDLRTWVAEKAVSQKLQSRFAFGGEIQITGLKGEIEVDGILVQPRLRLRVTDTGVTEPATWLVARRDTRYLTVGTLMSVETQRRANGETAERLAGEGPLRGEVVTASDEELLLRVGDNNVIVDPSNYTLTVRSPYVRRFYSSTTLIRLQAASGSLTASGKRNRYAVKDRYAALAAAMEEFGWTVTMPRERQAIIDRAWIEVRIQGAE
jgi:hypothetical protein